MMTEERFWELIDLSREHARKIPRPSSRDFIDVHEQALGDLLRSLSPEEICDFGACFDKFRQQAYRWDIWAAAYWLHGGCSDDGFIDFRSCLISLGKKAFFQVLNNPDVLAELVDQPDMPYLQSEGFQYVAGSIYEEKTGEEMPFRLEVDDGFDSEPAGEQFDFDDAELMAKRFPRLVEKYPEMGD